MNYLFINSSKRRLCYPLTLQPRWGGEMKDPENEVAYSVKMTLTNSFDAPLFCFVSHLINHVINQFIIV